MARFINTGNGDVKLNKALSACVDLPDQDYEMVQFTEAWARERMPEVRKIARGTVSIESKLYRAVSDLQVLTAILFTG